MTMAERLESLETAPTAVRELELRLERERLAAKAQLDRSSSFILASASPRRRDLLAGLGLTFEVYAADIPEIPRSGETPEQFARRAAAEKAIFVASRHPGRQVLAADTVVALGSEILGKPRDRDEARRMLESLSARQHRVCTGIALVVERDLPDLVVVVSEVVFHPLSAAVIETYIDSGEPFDKAGAYGIQSGAGRFVESVSGSYSNVIGLPLMETVALLTGRREHR
jgi:septum formation protein